MTSTPKTLTTGETESLLMLLRHPIPTKMNAPRAIRNYTMALIMLDAGLRVGEVVQLKVNDLYIGDHPVNNLVIRAAIAKTKKERIIPISARLAESLCEMVLYVWDNPGRNGRDPAFAATNSVNPLTVRAVQRMIEKYSWISLDRKISPHMLRHTFATRVMVKTNIRVVQELLGHSSLNSTQIYTHPNHDDLTNAIAGISENAETETA